jgi:hypothetical protein
MCVAHMRHTGEDLLNSHVNPADSVIALHFLSGQGRIARGFMHQEFMCVYFDEKGFMFLTVIRAIGEDGLLVFDGGKE